MRWLLAFALAAACLWGQRREIGPEPGRFDYYVLALSWSPEYCASQGGARDKLQCVDRRYGFVTHGLWPQFEKGFPRNCRGTGEPSYDTVQRMLDIMPSPGLVRHEWRSHGTCSGLTPGVYFDVVRRYYAAIRIPKAFQEPEKTILIEPGELKKRFLEANTGMNAESLAVLCSGRNLRELRVCLTKEGKPRPCGRDVRDQCAVDKAVLRPVR
ncbi:MAG: ribonuclease T2 [Bryobacterales bacterium]|nr:ribonuclease T2 [Bryobacterales bacterium]